MLIWAQQLQQQIIDTVAVSEAEVKDYYDNHKIITLVQKSSNCKKYWSIMSHWLTTSIDGLPLVKI